MAKRKKRRAQGAAAKLSFMDELAEQEEEGDGREGDGCATHGGREKKSRQGLAKLGKDPTVETGFLPDRWAKMPTHPYVRMYLWLKGE